MQLHAFWQPDCYVMSFWVEGAADPGPARPHRHPGDLPFTRLQELLPPGLDPFDNEHALALPTVDGTPCPSDTPIPHSATLERWRVTCADVVSDSAIEYLRGAPPDTVEYDGLRWGPSTRYWRQVLAFAVWLFDVRAFLPGVVRLEERYYPLWQTMFVPEAVDAWRSVERAMPPLCRALDGGDTPASHLALTYLDAAVDFLVRRRLRLRNPSFAPSQRKPPAPRRQWLETLRDGRTAFLKGREHTVRELAAAVSGWNAPLRPLHDDLAFRLGFALGVPATAEAPWAAQFFVTSLRNPALRFRAEAVWGRSDGARAFEPDLHRALLQGLGEAGRHFPQLREALASRRPAACKLSRGEVLQFVSKTAPALRLHGFVVEVPEWLEKTNRGLGLRLRLEGPAAATAEAPETALGVNQLVRYRWEVMLGEAELSLEELRRIAVADDELLHLSGRWLRVDREAVSETLALLEREGDGGQLTLNEAMQRSTDYSRRGLPVVDLRVEGDAPQLFAGLQPGLPFEQLRLPKGFKGRLRPYQRVGYSWLAFLYRLGFGGCLADDMGLGKTIQMIAFLVHRRRQEKAAPPALIVCPMSLVGNWRKELARFAPGLKTMVHHGIDRDSPARFAAVTGKQDVVITTYALIVRDQASFTRCRWDAIILDEAQNIKNPKTKQTTAIRSLRGNGRFCLTGTPVENRLAELWSIVDFINPGYLGSHAAFRQTFAGPIQRNRDPQRAGLLRQMIQPFVLRRLKSDESVARDLPEKEEIRVYCNLTAEQAALYGAVVQEMLQDLDRKEGIARRGVILGTLSKLKQLTNHPSHFAPDSGAFTPDRSGKLERLEAMLETALEEGHKALVFTQFAKLGGMLHERLQQRFGVEVLFMHGGCRQAERDDMVHRFQRHNGPPIFLLTLKTGGAGLNLTAASHVFHFDRWWNPAVEDQATDRAHRIGQTRRVQVHKFICVGTVEERIDEMIEQKRLLSEQIVGAGEHAITEMNTDQLRQLFQLSQDVVLEST